MEIYLNEKYNNLKIKTSNNIVAFYGENNSGKTSFINDFVSLMQNRKKGVFSEQEYDDTRDYIHIAEEWDLKRELALRKTSILRKFILKHLLDKLETENVDLTKILRENKELNLILNTMSKYVKFDDDNYHLNPTFNFKNDTEIIELLFKIAILNKDNDEVEEKWLSKSEKLNIYINLIIELESKNKIFIFDCPETYLDPVEIYKLSQLINNLAKNNLIIITFRNPALMKHLNIGIDEFFYLSTFEKRIKKFYISDNYLLNYYAFSNKTFPKLKIDAYYDFEIYLKNLTLVTEREDYKKIEREFMVITLPYLLRNINLKTFKFYGNIDMLTENEKFKLILFLIINNIEYEKVRFSHWILSYYEQIRA